MVKDVPPHLLDEIEHFFNVYKMLEHKTTITDGLGGRRRSRWTIVDEAFVRAGGAIMIPRYTLPEMGAIWEERAKFRHWLLIEVLAAEAWSKLGVVPRSGDDEIRERATEVDPARVEEIEETSRARRRSRS